MIRNAADDEDLDPGYEAALCEDYMSPWSPVELQQAVYAFRRWTAMRFLIHGEMTVYFSVTP